MMLNIQCTMLYSTVQYMQYYCQTVDVSCLLCEYCLASGNVCACEIAGTKPTAGVRARLNPSALSARVCEIHPGNWTWQDTDLVMEARRLFPCLPRNSTYFLVFVGSAIRHSHCSAHLKMLFSRDFRSLGFSSHFLKMFEKKFVENVHFSKSYLIDWSLVLFLVEHKKNSS